MLNGDLKAISQGWAKDSRRSAEQFVFKQLAGLSFIIRSFGVRWR
jgi:hypothetical protein